MKNRFAQGFTLIELLVVIGIIGILMTVAFVGFSGSTESARAAKCMTNMRGLATAVQNYGMAVGWYPHAGSVESVAASSGSRGGMVYTEHPGWVSWLSQGKYNKSHQASSSMRGGCALPTLSETDLTKSLFALTNGAIWAYTGKSHATYTCPSHLELCRKAENGAFVPQWSYMMNSYFGYDRLQQALVSGAGNAKEYGTVSAPDRRLLFAEIPFLTIEGTAQASPVLNGGTGTKILDPILDYDNGYASAPESIGFNHKAGKKYMAHVAFADGHVAKMAMPNAGSESEIRELTKWLCRGDEISYDGRRYQRVVESGSN